MNKFIKNIFIGLSFGFTSDIIIMFIFKGNQNAGNLASIWLMSALIGLVSSVFYIEKLSLLVKTIIQFTASFILFSITGIYNSWFEYNIVSFGISFGVFLIVFLFIWGSIYLYEKNQIKKINRSIAMKNDF